MRNPWLYWCLWYLFVELLQLHLNAILIPLLDALDNRLDVHIHTSWAQTHIHMYTSHI